MNVEKRLEKSIRLIITSLCVLLSASTAGVIIQTYRLGSSRRQLDEYRIQLEAARNQQQVLTATIEQCQSTIAQCSETVGRTSEILSKTSSNTATSSATSQKVTVEKSRATTGKTTPKTHTVTANDTLWAIAKKYLGDGSKYTELAKLNNLSNPNIIKAGQVIKLE